MPTRKSLKTADAKLRMIEDKLGVGTWTWDLDTSEVMWSPGLCRILGVDPHTVVPSIDLYQSLVHPDDQLDFDDAIGIVSDKRLESRRFRVIRPDGGLRWLHSKAEPHFDRNGRTIMLTGVIRDVTEEEDTREAYFVQKETNKILMKHLSGWVWRAYPNGKLMETAHWMKLTGQTPQEAHDWDKLAAIHPDDRQLFRDTWSEAIAKKIPYDATIRVRTVDGIYVARHSRAIPLIDEKGDILQWIGHSTLVADRRMDIVTKGLLGSAQIRASRALLNWTGPELAERSGVSFSTVRRMEQCSTAVRADSLVRVQATFESAGIAFITDEDGQLAMSFAASVGQPTMEPAARRAVPTGPEN